MVTNNVPVSPKQEIANLKKKIEGARNALKSPLLQNDPVTKQNYYDQISEYQRRIEELTREERTIVQITNAPTVAARGSSGKRRRAGFFSTF